MMATPAGMPEPRPPRLILGDCLDVMAGMEAGSVDAVVTDPPYELKFMSRKWDGTGVAFRAETWAECLRILKPGGHLLTFGGTRTYHRMTCAIEDAGLEIRDTIHWIYGSGFPKSLDVSKAIDKMAGAEREVVGVRKRCGGPAGMTPDRGWNAGPMTDDDSTVEVTAPATEAARRWAGWGTALKPAHEPIVVARKPLCGTVAANVTGYGVGGLNIDACRVATGDDRARPPRTPNGIYGNGNGTNLTPSESNPAGRWPSNICLTHSAACRPAGTRKVRGSHGPNGSRPGTPRDDTEGYRFRASGVNYVSPDGTETVAAWECAEGCPVVELDRQSGETRDGVAGKRSGVAHVTLHGLGAYDEPWGTYGGKGGASRFFPTFAWSDADFFPLRSGNCDLCSLLSGSEIGTISWDHDSQEIAQCRDVNSAGSSSSPPAKPSDSAHHHARDAGPPGSEDNCPDRHTSVLNAEDHSRDIQGTIRSTAPSDAPNSPIEKTALNAKSAASLCDSCATGIARNLAAIGRGHAPESLATPVSISEPSRLILNRSLVQLAESLENSDTIPTTASLKMWFGYVTHAIASITGSLASEVNAIAPIRSPIESLDFPGFYCPKASRRERNDGLEGMPIRSGPNMNHAGRDLTNPRNFIPGGTRDRVAKGLPPVEPSANHHPTVKPLSLMKWLCRLITPPGGTVLDPFMGSGTTGLACMAEGFGFVGIESDPEYHRIASRRLAEAAASTPLFAVSASSDAP